MVDERIHVLRDILLELHNGASPESVQERFDATFAGVSAIEISLMEHELMNSESGVTFEDVMELCDVHANLFKNAIKGVEVSDTEHPGHPVRVFKEENLALRAA
ncbi:hemerythrin HHE cation binding domain subfamily, putative [Streptococcus pneumoniae 801]|nr:hemerythrin HHE cation binding domain subfamily, putative [Streptococcus pneumoniae 801]